MLFMSFSLKHYNHDFLIVHLFFFISKKWIFATTLNDSLGLPIPENCPTMSGQAEGEGSVVRR